MPNLYTVRHSEPEVSGLLLGQSDPGLSPAGAEQASGLLANVEASVIYSSPLRRALETALLLARGREVIVLGELTEITYGVWDGLAWSQIAAQWPDLAAAKLADWPSVTPPGGEEWQQFADRVAGVLNVARNGPAPAVIVAHSTVNSILDHLITGSDPFRFVQACGEVRQYEL